MPGEVFRPAIRCNAAAVILAHNHPSGEVTPSKEDVDITADLVRAGKLLGISLSITLLLQKILLLVLVQIINLISKGVVNLF